MLRELNRMAAGLAMAFLLLALWTGVWGLARGPDLLGRPDNPRRYFAEQRSRRGSILDRHSAPLALSETSEAGYRRRWLTPEAAPVTGYSSILYGRTGIESALDPVLSGELGRDPREAWWQDLMIGFPPHGQSVRLTLDAILQQIAVDGLGDRSGAVVLIGIPSGDVLVLASTPGFDPNRIEADWSALGQDARAPLLNRATLGLYQPGGSLEPIVMSAALMEGQAQLDSLVQEGRTTVAVDGHEIDCTQPLDEEVAELTMATAFGHACPAPFAALGQRLGAARLIQAFSEFGLFAAPEVLVDTAASPRPDPASTPAGDAGRVAIGQSQTTVSPLQMALIIAGLGNRGVIPAPRLLDAMELPSGAWLTRAAQGHPRAAVTPEVAETMRALMTGAAHTPIGRIAGLGSIPAGGHISTAVSGPEGKSQAWFLGFAPTVRPKYAIAVLLEDPHPEDAARIGAAVLRAAMGTRP